MVDLPLIVTRKNGKQWFPEALSLTDGKLWVQHDGALRGYTAAMARGTAVAPKCSSPGDPRATEIR